jgi:hypothetical protein
MQREQPVPLMACAEKRLQAYQIKNMEQKIFFSNEGKSP